MIDLMTGMFHQYYDQLITWYSGAGNLTQYAVMMAAGITFFMITVFMILSRITK